MISIGFIFMGVVTALAVLAIFAKFCQGAPKRAEKREKGEIIKQLLALSEHENSISATASSPTKSLRPSPASARHSDTLRKGTYREQNSRRKYFSISSNSSIPLRPNLSDAEIDEKIRQRAYELYQGRGGVGGTATEDWQKAKQEVLSGKAKAATTSS